MTQPLAEHRSRAALPPFLMGAPKKKNEIDVPVVGAALLCHNFSAVSISAVHAGKRSLPLPAHTACFRVGLVREVEDVPRYLQCVSIPEPW